jgi:hypothetical protein
MKRLLPLLEKRPLAVALLIAALVAAFLATQVISSRVTPYTDGNHYVQRAFALYGFLHTGQWGKFWELFTLPRQTLLPPQYPLFWLMPRAWAGIAAYGAVQLLVNFGILALANWNLCRVFGRPTWTPALFLLCACENYSFDYPYFFFLDLTFAALATLALSFQVDAWRWPSTRTGAIAGAATGFLFWVKPANALIFTAIFLLCEALWAAWPLFAKAGPRDWRPWRPRVIGWLAGFVPVTLLAGLCGAWQTFFLLIQNNELSHEWETHLQVTGLLRLFYFPLCFAYFYNAVIVLLLACGLLAAARWMRRDPAAETTATAGPFPARALWVLVLGYAIFGEFFSFWVLVKTMRALVFMLPVLWLLLFRLAERARVRPEWLFLGALAYGAVLADQVATDSFESKPLLPDKFLLADNWYDLPMAWIHYAPGYGIVTHLRDVIAGQLPQGGRVGVTTERVFLDGRSLALQLNGEALLDGRAPRYSCVRLFDAEGRDSPAAFLTADALILYVTCARGHRPARLCARPLGRAGNDPRGDQSGRPPARLLRASARAPHRRAARRRHESVRFARAHARRPSRRIHLRTPLHLARMYRHPPALDTGAFWLAVSNYFVVFNSVLLSGASRWSRRISFRG